MKEIFSLFIFFICFTLKAQGPCPKNAGEFQEIQNCLKDGVQILGHDPSMPESLEAAMANGRLFLDLYKDRVDFEVSTAKKILEGLEKFGGSDKVSQEERSQLWFMASGIHGRLSDKLRVHGGATQGKLAIECLKKSLALNKNNKNAAKTYGTIITHFIEKNFVSRAFIEQAMGIDISVEAKLALKALKENGLETDPIYQKLKDF